MAYDLNLLLSIYVSASICSQNSKSGESKYTPRTSIHLCDPFKSKIVIIFIA